MTEPLRSGNRIFDADGDRWIWTDEQDIGDLWSDSSWSEREDGEPVPIDFDAIPTHAELEAGLATGPVVSLVDEPHAIALPDVYEPGYCYPLVIWFHDAGGNEESVFEVLPQISERNYLAVALRGNLPLGAHDAAWSVAETGAESLLDKLEQAIERMADQFTIHRERIYLAGVGSGGTTAVELLLQRPEAFAGAASLGGAFPQLAHPLAKFRGLRGRRVLLTTSLDCPNVKITDLVNSGRMLYSAGVQVGTRIYQQPGGVPSPRMFRDLDGWIMDGISSAVRVPVK
jgi:phospholipase/carboxylesterase